MPVWRRDRDGSLVDCNLAYAASLGAAREVVLAEARELVPAGSGDAASALASMFRAGGSRAEQTHVVIGGQRRLLEITEVPCAAGGTIGFALDRTDVEAARAELWRHINAHAEVLESICAAVAIYGPDKRLKFLQPAPSPACGGSRRPGSPREPSLGEFLERLREPAASRNSPISAPSSASDASCSPR